MNTILKPISLSKLKSGPVFFLRHYLYFFLSHHISSNSAMLLIHLLPYNRNNHPWCVDFISVNSEDMTQIKQYRVVLKTPLGVCPSPLYAVSFDCDCIKTIAENGTGPLAAGKRISAILEKEEYLVFSGSKAYLMFRELMASLMMPDLLKNKKVSSLKSILNVAHTLKGMYDKSLIGNIKKLSESLGHTGNRFINSMYAVFRDLYTGVPKLADYFIKQSMVLDTVKSADKIILGIGEGDYYIFTPLLVTQDYIFGLDLSSEIKSCKLPVNGTVCYTVSSAITEGIAASLNTDFAEIKKRFADFQKAKIEENAVSRYMALLNSDETVRMDILADRGYQRTEDVFAGIRKLSINSSDPDTIKMASFLPKIQGDMLIKMLDFIYLEGGILPAGYEGLYNDVVSGRITAARDTLVSELEYATAAAERDNNEESISRLANIYKSLS